MDFTFAGALLPSLGPLVALLLIRLSFLTACALAAGFAWILVLVSRARRSEQRAPATERNRMSKP